MRIRFELSGSGSEQELRSLYQWLSDDRDLRGRVRIVAEDETRPGEMGGAFDAVVAVLSTGAALGQLAVAYAAWRDSRNLRSAVTFVVRGGDEEAVRRALGGAEGTEGAEDGE